MASPTLDCSDTTCYQEHAGVALPPAPYSYINVLPYKEQGWYLPENQRYLRQFIADKKPKIIVEVGSWLGSSTIDMAKHLSIANPAGKLYAVDTWQGSIEHQQTQELQDQLKVLYQQFLSNVIHQGMTHVIIPCRMTSVEAASALNVRPDLVYIDGAHDRDNVYQDVMHWYPKLASGGILCGDDWGAAQPAVFRAIKILGQRVEWDTSFWYFSPKP